MNKYLAQKLKIAYNFYCLTVLISTRDLFFEAKNILIANAVSIGFASCVKPSDSFTKQRNDWAAFLF